MARVFLAIKKESLSITHITPIITQWRYIVTLIRSWILMLTAAALVVAAAQALMPEGSVKRVGKLTGGLILALALIQPLTRLDYNALWAQVISLPAGAIQQEILQEEATAPLQEGIEETLSAYVEEQGKTLGISCQVQVTCTTGEDGVPIPQHVTVFGALNEVQRDALSDFLSQQLGLETDRQTYLDQEWEGSP